jgi:hypothetical protein
MIVGHFYRRLSDMGKRNAKEDPEDVAKAARLAAYGDKIKDPEEYEEAQREARAEGHAELRAALES